MTREPTASAAMPPALRLDLDLRCPLCAGEIDMAGTLLTCPACKRRWPITGGVFHFGDAVGLPQSLASHQLKELVSIGEREGWQVALHDHLRQLDPESYRTAVDEYSLQWRCLVPNFPDGRVLDFRSGWGRIALGLADDFGLVVTADFCFEFARLTALRAKAGDMENLQAMCLDSTQRLPFPSNYFELVVLHEVVEWSRPDLLQEVSRVLKDGGWLFLLATNRLSPVRLLKAAQQYRNWGERAASGPAARQGDGLPVPMLASEPEPRPRSLLAYQKSLASAGLRVREAYAVLPSPSRPFYMVPLESGDALRYLFDSVLNSGEILQAMHQRHLSLPYQVARVGWRLARWLPLGWLLRILVPAYGLMAQKAK